MTKYRMEPRFDQIRAAFGSTKSRKETQAGRLLGWAIFSVAAVHYAADLDDLTFTMSPPNLLGHQPDVVDIAHASWITGQAFTALDLCAAALGRLYLPTRRGELSLSQIRPWAPNAKRKTVQKAREKLPKEALAWTRAVWIDPRYQELRAARHPFAHSTVKRFLVRPIPPGHDGRTSFRLSGVRGSDVEPRTSITRRAVPARLLVEHARDVATLHVEALLDLLSDRSL
jgi:hypothetical protein